MNDVELGEVIASRRLKMKTNKEVIMIDVVIGKPRQWSESTDFFVPYQIHGVGRENVKHASGVDAIQSLQLALKMIGVELEVLNNKPNLQIIWECGENGDFGFPLD